MIDYAVCTSFSPQGYEIYGRRFLETFLNFWPENIPIMVVYEHKVPDIKDPRIIYRDLFDDKPWMDFRAKWRGDPKVDSSSHIYGAMKFSRKIFALNGEQFDSKWLLWIDADVETIKPIDDPFLGAVAPLNHQYVVSYLNREFWRYSECGFVGYNLQVPPAKQLLGDILEMYTSGKFHKLSEYGDSYVFDVCRRAMFGKDKSPYTLRLTPRQNMKNINVWPTSVLGEYMLHHKGPSRKKARYGSSV
jgi:hypothetical protein